MGTSTWSLPALLILLCKAPFGVGGHRALATCLTPRAAFQLVLASIWVSSLEACLAVSQLLPDELWLSTGQRRTVPGWLPQPGTQTEGSLAIICLRWPMVGLLHPGHSGSDQTVHPLPMQDENIMSSMQLFENVI